MSPDFFQPKNMLEPLLIFQKNVKNGEKDKKTDNGVYKKQRPPYPADREKNMMQSPSHGLNCENRQ